MNSEIGLIMVFLYSWWFVFIYECELFDQFQVLLLYVLLLFVFEEIDMVFIFKKIYSFNVKLFYYDFVQVLDEVDRFVDVIREVRNMVLLFSEFGEKMGDMVCII